MSGEADVLFDCPRLEARISPRSCAMRSVRAEALVRTAHRAKTGEGWKPHRWRHCSICRGCAIGHDNAERLGVEAPGEAKKSPRLTAPKADRRWVERDA